MRVASLDAGAARPRARASAPVVPPLLLLSPARARSDLSDARPLRSQAPEALLGKGAPARASNRRCLASTCCPPRSLFRAHANGVVRWL